VLDGLDAVAPDLPGFGATAPPEVPWGSADYAEAASPLCRENGPVVLVGHSFGGRVALLIAASHPELVRALVLTGVPLMRPPGSRRPRSGLGFVAARALHRVGILSDERWEARRRRSGPPDYRAAVGVMRDVFVRVVNETDDGTYRRALGRVCCPVDLVWGEHDSAAPPAVAREAARLAEQATVTVVPAVGHLLPVEAPHALRDVVERRLGSAPRSAPGPHSAPGPRSAPSVPTPQSAQST